MDEDKEHQQSIEQLVSEAIQLKINYDSGREYIHHVNRIIRLAQQLPHTVNGII